MEVSKFRGLEVSSSTGLELSSFGDFEVWRAPDIICLMFVLLVLLTRASTGCTILTRSDWVRTAVRILEC